MLLFCYIYDNTHWGVIIVLLFSSRDGEAPSDFDRKAALCNSWTDRSLQAVQPPSASASPTENAGSLCSQCLSCGTKQNLSWLWQHMLPVGSKPRTVVRKDCQEWLSGKALYSKFPLPLHFLPTRGHFITLASSQGEDGAQLLKSPRRRIKVE